MNITPLEKILAESLARCTGADIPAIILAAQEACMGGCKTVADTAVEVVTTPAPTLNNGKPTPKKKTVEPSKDNPTEEPKLPSEPIAPPAENPSVTATGIDLTGLFTGSGADKKVVKDVFLAAVEKAKTLAHLVALNATCDCGFATDLYNEETAPVLRRKLTRWGAAQE